MRANPLLLKTWVSIQEAASIIGREMDYAKWSENILTSPMDSPIILAITNDLRKVFSSGEVSIQLDNSADFLGPCSMDAIMANQHGFVIDIPRNRIELRQPDDIWDCRINRADLEKFLTKYRHLRLDNSSEQERQADCVAWLLSHDQKKRIADFEREGTEKFKLSSSAFKRAWAQVVKQRPEWSNPGRPKSGQ